MKSTLVVALVLVAGLAAAHAQSEAPETTTSPSKEIAILEARLADMEAQLATCRDEVKDARERGPTTAQPMPANLPSPAPGYMPSGRPGNGFRMAPEPRLSCEDYSESYFARHPTMAKVCGKNASDQTLPQPILLPEDAESPTKAQ